MIDFYNLYQNLTLVLLFEGIRDYLGRRNLTLILFYVPSTPKLPVSKDEEFTDRSVELDCTFLIVRIVFIPSLSRVFFILYDATCQTWFLVILSVELILVPQSKAYVWVTANLALIYKAKMSCTQFKLH